MTNRDNGESSTSPVNRTTVRSVAVVIWSTTAVVCSITALLTALGGNFKATALWIAGVTVSICVAGSLRA